MLPTTGLTIALTAVIPVMLGGCSGSVSFNNDVQPILNASCIECHDVGGEGKADAGLSLISYQDVIKGTQHGSIITRGDHASSTLYLVISHQVDTKIQMPPHHHDKFPMGEGEPLTEEQIKTIGDWIDQGAENN